MTSQTSFLKTYPLPSQRWRPCAAPRSKSLVRALLRRSSAALMSSLWPSSPSIVLELLDSPKCSRRRVPKRRYRVPTIERLRAERLDDERRSGPRWPASTGRPLRVRPRVPWRHQLLVLRQCRQVSQLPRHRFSQHFPVRTRCRISFRGD